MVGWRVLGLGIFMHDATEELFFLGEELGTLEEGDVFLFNDVLDN